MARKPRPGLVRSDPLPSGVPGSGITVSDDAQIDLDETAIAGRYLGSVILTKDSTSPYVIPAGTHTVDAEGIGPGAGGGGVAGAAGNAAAAGGGGPGGRFRITLTVSPTDELVFVIPDGGAGGAAGENPGAAAIADTTLTYAGVTYTASKGTGGGASAATTGPAIRPGGTSGNGTNGTENSKGQPGMDGIILSSTVSKSGNGGQSPSGDGGAPGRASNGAGTDATGFGSGGSGANQSNNAANSAGGKGAPGRITLRLYS